MPEDEVPVTGLDAELREKIASSVMLWMASNKLSIAKLAEEADIGRQTIYDLRDKKRLTGPEVLAKIAAVFGTTPGTLLDGRGPQDQSDNLTRPAFVDRLQELEGDVAQLAPLTDSVIAINDVFRTLLALPELSLASRRSLLAKLPSLPADRS